MIVWILAACLAGALLLAITLWISLRRSHSRTDDADRLLLEARRAVQQEVDEATALHTAEIRRVLAVERAASASALADEERRLSEDRRGSFLERERKAGEELSDLLARGERRLEERLRGFADDLERAQRHLETQLARLQQRQTHALQEVEARIDADAAELGSTADEQRKSVFRLREELERVANEAVAEALEELETHTAERRRAIDEINERLKVRESAIAESLERAEVDVRARLDVLLVEWERRQTANLERVMEREVERHAQIAMLAFDERLREAREDAATRLHRELDRAVELLSREELGRRLESDG